MPSHPCLLCFPDTLQTWNGNRNENDWGKKSRSCNDYSANKYVGFNPMEKLKQDWGYEYNCQMQESDGMLYFWDSWENGTHLSSLVFLSSCLASAWAWVSEGMKSAGDLHQWVLTTQPCSNPKGSYKYLKWVYYKYSCANLHWIDML